MEKMDELLPNYSVWRHKYAKACVIVYFIVIIMEFVIFLLFKNNNMIEGSLHAYLRRYFFTPDTIKQARARY